MGRPALTDAAVADFRRRASEVSLRLFVEQGYEGFTLRALAKELGCSHTTPYRYFDGKAEIFAVVRAEGFRRFQAALERRLAEHTDPLARVRCLASAYFDFSRDERAAFTIIFRMDLPEGDAFDFVREAAFEAWSVLYRVIREAVDARVLVGDPNTLAHTMWAGVHGVATLHLANELSMGCSADTMLEAITEALLRAHQGDAEP